MLGRRWPAYTVAAGRSRSPKRARATGSKSAVRPTSPMACWTRGSMKRRSSSSNTPWRWRGSLFQRFLITLGSTYQALQQWQEVRSTLEEAEAMAETLDLGPFRVPALSQLCMHYAEAGEWEAAYRYAVKAIVLRKSFDVALIPLDFSPQYETEALLRGGDERQAREEVHRLRERLGPNPRFRIPYLRSLAVPAARGGGPKPALDPPRRGARAAGGR